MDWIYDDGGRKESGYKGETGDCVVRAVAIATGRPYKVIYEELRALNKKHSETRNTRVSRALKRKGSTPRNGNFKEVYDGYIKSLGFKWIPTMEFGKGCSVHLCADELPGGMIICRVSKHLTVVDNGVIKDTHDCSRAETRCVYGYYEKIKSD